MGLKHRAKELARAAGVPVLPDAAIAGEDPAEWCAAADRVGYPLLVKASAGGGGRGMRRVTHAEGLVDAIDGARREAAASFGDPEVFLERFVPAARHIEIQVIGDTQGNVVHLLERECSVQRRHQKVLEEAPSPAVTPPLRGAMADSAVALARTLGYVGVGTVEFLVDGDGDGGRFFFLEMNTRLQVEHPVTEAITGLDLVPLQLLVAGGEPLPMGQDEVSAKGHSVEARLYAEDITRGFSPTFGPFWRYDHGPQVPAGIRYDDGVSSGSEISTFYDAMLSKVVAHAPTRREACARLARALGGMRLFGPKTNRDFLVRILRSPEFQAGSARTDFVESHPELSEEVCDEDTVTAHLAAVVVSTAIRRRARSVVPVAPPGWRLFPDGGRQATWSRRDGGEVAVTYQVDDDAITSAVAGHSRRFGFSVSDEGTTVVIRADRVQRICRVDHAPDGTVWVHDGEAQTCWVEQVRLPAPGLEATAGAPVAELPGTVVAVLVKPGQTVAAGTRS